MSSNRDTSFVFNQTDSMQTLTIESAPTAPLCFVELKLPGEKELLEVTFNFNGDTISDLRLTDTKEDYEWEKPLNILTLKIKVTDAYPQIDLKSEHTINSLEIDGNYCIASLEKVKIKYMTVNLKVGSLYILQNKVYQENSLSLESYYGTYFASGKLINSNKGANCPSIDDRLVGFFGDYPDPSTV